MNDTKSILLVGVGGQGTILASKLLSEGLVAVIQQSLSKNNDASRRLTLQTLLFTGADGPGIREKVRAGKVSLLDQDIVNQSSRSLWNDQ